MRKKIHSSTRLSINSAHSVHRSFTPISTFIPSLLTPTAHENQFLKLLNTPKKYSILTVPPKSFILTEKFNLNRETQPPMPSTPAIQPRIRKQKSEKISLAKIKKIKRSYRSHHNPNEENLKAELQKLAENPVQRPILCEKNDAKIEEKSDIEKLLESQNFSKSSRNRKKNLVIKIQQAPVEEVNDKKNEDTENCEWEEEKSIINNKSETPVHIIDKTFPFITDSSNKKCLRITKNHSKLPDYKEQSWEILKNTAFLAEKIMKNIRGNARIKSFYLG